MTDTKTDADTDADADNQRNCPLGCNKLRLGTDDATGFFYARSGMGPIIVSNLFLRSVQVQGLEFSLEA